MFKRNYMYPMNQMQNGCCEQNCPIVEPAINKCVEREFCHEVNQE